MFGFIGPVPLRRVPGGVEPRLAVETLLRSPIVGNARRHDSHFTVPNLSTHAAQTEAACRVGRCPPETSTYSKRSDRVDNAQSLMAAAVTAVSSAPRKATTGAAIVP